MRDDALFLKHIFNAIGVIEEYTSDVTHLVFIQNGMIQDAVMRQLEIIGEAARNLSDEIRAEHPDVEWGQIIGMRNRLIHAYFQVDTELIWEIISIDLPLLKREVEGMISERS